MLSRDATVSISRRRSVDRSARLHRLLVSLRAPRARYRPLPVSLTDAAIRGDIQAARAFLDAGADLAERTIGFGSPLHAACGSGRLEMARFLHARGAPLIAEDEIFSCIHFAAASGHLPIVAWALEAGFPASHARSALAAAASAGHYEVVQCLIEHGVDPGSAPASALVMAPPAGPSRLKQRSSPGISHDEGRLRDGEERQQGIEEAMALMKGARSTINDKDAEGVPPIVRAVITCEAALVRVALDAGADPNSRADFGGLTPLTEACALGAPDLVNLLLDRGADIDLGNGSGRTPLMTACLRGDLELSRLLLRRGADRQRKDSAGNRALKLIAGPYREQLRTLLKSRAMVIQED